MQDKVDEIVKKNQKNNESHKKQVQLDQFYSYAPDNKFIFTPTREFWVPKSVDSRLPAKDGIKATDWLSKNQSVELMTWAPGLPMLIEDKIISNGQITDCQGVKTFNLYCPPTIGLGNSDCATPWVELVQRVYPDHYEHIINWLAHRVQLPGEKINHALVLGGAPGIGKDTIVEPVIQAIGNWNFQDVTPKQLMGRFNGFIKSVILRVSEARDLGEVDRYGLYEHLKIYTAAPPNVLRCDEKNKREYGVMNVCGVIITTNHKSGGIYLPADDRRHFVAWSECTKENFKKVYWEDLWSWYEKGGHGHVAAYLKSRDLDKFDPKAPPEKTTEFWEIVDAARAPEDAEMADALDDLGNPVAVTIGMILEKGANEDFCNWLSDRRNRRKIPHRFETAGYVRVLNNDAKDGLWVKSGKRNVIYAKKELTKRDRIVAAKNLMRV